MKALTTNGLTKLIQLIKSSFISKTDTVTTNTVTLATVATSGSYNDLSNKPTIPTVDQTFDGISVNAQSGVAIAGELENYVPLSSQDDIEIQANTINFSTSNSNVTIDSFPILIQGSNPLSESDSSSFYVDDSMLEYYDGHGHRLFYSEPSGSGFWVRDYSSGTYPDYFNIDFNINGIYVGTYKNSEVVSANITVPSDDTLAIDGHNIITDNNLKTINNQSIIGSGNISITVPTAISDLTDDTSTTPIDKAESVADQRDSSSLKYWTGTKAQYDAIVTKDNDTIYNVEDTTSPIVDILNTLYPIGAIYIGTMATCPLSVLGVGTWQLVAQDRVLQGAGTRGAVGTTINESLPNIKGEGWNIGGASNSDWSGVFSSNIAGRYALSSGTSNGAGKLYFDASDSSSIYQDNAPVQQDGYLVNIWERIA